MNKYLCHLVDPAWERGLPAEYVHARSTKAAAEAFVIQHVTRLSRYRTGSLKIRVVDRNKTRDYIIYVTVTAKLVR